MKYYVQSNEEGNGLIASEEEIDGVAYDTLEEAQAAYDALSFELRDYFKKRAVRYPSIEDQLDTIFHEGIDAWKAEIQAVKDAYPKPTE